MKKCPYCAEEIQDAAIICRYCRRNLPVIEPPNTQKPINSLKSFVKEEKLLTFFVTLTAVILGCMTLGFLVAMYAIVTSPNYSLANAIPKFSLPSKPTDSPPSPTTTSYTTTFNPTSAPIFETKGDFEMSWNTYDSQYDTYGSILTIRKQGSTYTMSQKFSDGSGVTVPLTGKIVKGQERLYDGRFDDYYGDYMVISSDGYLNFLG